MARQSICAFDFILKNIAEQRVKGHLERERKENIKSKTPQVT